MKPWLQLFRPPNLFTVPGDPLAGYLLASAGAGTFRPAIAAIIGASLLFYGFGLVLNDLMDFHEDLHERPKRPLPSRAVNKKAAALVIRFLAAVALFLCWITGPGAFLCGCALLLAIIAYNCCLKKIPVVGAINMGACRGLNVLLGATLAPPAAPSFVIHHSFPQSGIISSIPVPALIAAALITAYITAVTLLARRETENPAIPPLIGRLIRALILIQAGFCAFSGGLAGWISASILALALWPLSRIVGKRFYAS